MTRSGALFADDMQLILVAGASKANFVAPAGSSVLVAIAANKPLGGTVAVSEQLMLSYFTICKSSLTNKIL